VATRTTTEQKDLLSAIELQAASLEMHQRQVDDTRRHLWELMEQAKDAKVSSYSIAKAAGLSQPRVMQIIKGIRVQNALRDEQESRDAEQPEPELQSAAHGEP
jgi:hypothetical protein